METKWMINTNAHGDLDISEDGGDMICDLQGCADAERNAETIVRAVNAHDALIKALEDAKSALSIVYQKRLEWHGDLATLEAVSSAAKAARAALALAKEG